MVWLSFHFNIIVGYFQTEQWKKKPDSKLEDHAVTRPFIPSVIQSFNQSARKLAAANFFHPSSQMITFSEWTVYTVHF
jgi:hypothetical protein